MAGDGARFMLLPSPGWYGISVSTPDGNSQRAVKHTCPVAMEEGIRWLPGISAAAYEGGRAR
jgi:hypothetical protein